ANNVLLVVACGTVLLGTLYPLIMDALGLGKLSVGPPYFNAVFVPLMAPLLFLIGIGPLARWKEASLAELARRLRWAFATGIATALLLPFALGAWTPLIALGLLLGTWIVGSVVVALWGRLRDASGKGSLWTRLKRQSRSYYGMHLAHLGVAVFVFGVTLVKGYETETDVRMAVGDTVTVGGYAFRFEGVAERPGPNYSALRGTVTVTRAGRYLSTLHPEKRFYPASGQTMTEAAIDYGLTRHLYVSLGEPLPDGAWSVRVYHKPFVGWIWGGCLLMALGGLLAIADRRYRVAGRRARQEEAKEVAAAGELVPQTERP
ncbi:cytochrome c-type biogenesis CcmF C-terminal domain-containing protein, partial [Pelomicrobium sp.]|uniref:cytochrome c-type biogenesis CcmF C-terminal domain-containing protein n=1 Tax=Pelomicrobium sp. TaxID=2815319 RepID=UPI002FDDE4AC